jgi:hypothetical protein
MKVRMLISCSLVATGIVGLGLALASERTALADGVIATDGGAQVLSAGDRDGGMVQQGLDSGFVLPDATRVNVSNFDPNHDH